MPWSGRPTLAQEKLKVEDLLARHLEAIGAAQARSVVTRRVVIGGAKMVVRIGGGGYLEGSGTLISSGAKVRYSMKFPHPEYPGEDMCFDGARSETGFLPAGRRSPLSQFLDQQGLPLKEGLLGGVLSSAWPLLRLDQQQPRLEYRGLKKLEGRQVHALGYRARKGSSDLKVTLFFEASTFRHVRTEYSFEIGARLGSGPDDSARVQESYYVLTEDFDDFKAVDELTLPHRYRLQLSVSTSGGSLLRDWTMVVDQISHKSNVDDQSFKIR
jgi:hypothetical protein